MLGHVERYLMGESVLQFAPVIGYLVFLVLGAGSGLSAFTTIQALSAITAIRTGTLPETVLLNVALDASLDTGKLLQTLFDPLLYGH